MLKSRWVLLLFSHLQNIIFIHYTYNFFNKDIKMVLILQVIINKILLYKQFYKLLLNINKLQRLKMRKMFK